jgi:Zn-dependent oligopeptidase
MPIIAGLSSHPTYLAKTNFDYSMPQTPAETMYMQEFVSNFCNSGIAHPTHHNKRIAATATFISQLSCQFSDNKKSSAS